MEFTALHLALGRRPGPLTDDMVEEAVTAGVRETANLDWKKALPEARDLATSDVPKDIAAMANSGGGVLVYGVEEDEKAATGRRDVGEISENYERSLRKVAVTTIHPPVFGLEVRQVGEPGQRALIVVISASIDGPHLIYKNDYFGAPVRNDADTVWMRERQIEDMYRSRLDERRNATEALDALYADTAAGRECMNHAWLVGVARPRIPFLAQTRMSREEARELFFDASKKTFEFAVNGRGHHPLEMVNRDNPRPGLRRWVAPSTASENMRWAESWASVHDNGAVTLAAVIGGQPRNNGFRSSNDDIPGGHSIDAASIERGVADLMALIKTSSSRCGRSDYEVRLGIEWTGTEPLLIYTIDQMGFYFTDGSIPLSRFTPILSSIRTNTDPPTYLQQVRDLSLDSVNQGGIQYLTVTKNIDQGQ